MSSDMTWGLEGEIKAITQWPSNAELIADCFRLGYLPLHGTILDTTYGLGTFWKLIYPATLVAHDLKIDNVDFRHLPHEDTSFDAVVLDGPYKLAGTPDPTERGVDERYGIDSPVPWQERIRLIIEGMTECERVLKRSGHLLVKCQNQVCSGKVRWQTITFANHGIDNLGLELVDELILPGGRPQPVGRRQVHARRNYSSLLIFRKGKK